MKKILALILVLLLLVAGGAFWVLQNYYIIDGQMYAGGSDMLDLREQDVSIDHYEKLCQAMPGCSILWNVPMENGTAPSDSRELAFSDLEEAARMLVYFPGLEVLDLRECSDLTGLSELMASYPELEVRIAPVLDGVRYDQDVSCITVSAMTEQELALLPMLTELESVLITEGTLEGIDGLLEYCEANGISVSFCLGDNRIGRETTGLTLSGTTDEQVQLLAWMDWLESIHIREPEAAAEALLTLREILPQTEISWEKTVLGMTFSSDATQIDLTDVIALAEGESAGTKTAYQYGLEFSVMGTKEKEPKTAKVLKEHPFPDKTEESRTFIPEVEAAMAYFPEAESLLMCGGWLDNEMMSQLRERHREDYKVIWTVRCGDVAPRTDTTFFMPTKYGVKQGGFNDFYSENLHYCEEIVAMDIGHMQVVDIEFVRYMPNLKYLVIMNQPVCDLSPLSSCKNLVFLEMMWTIRVDDYSSLLECTALEDLSIVGNYADISPILEMKWLKNLWMYDYDEQSCYRAKAALPNTNIACDLDKEEKSWRDLPNYFKMRDALLMFYMD